MKECDANLTRIALNLTDEQFKGYCKGMSLHWLFKSLRGNVSAGKRVKFWDRAYNKHKSSCES